MQEATPNPEIVLDSLSMSENTVSASQLYAQSLFQDILRSYGKRQSKHNKARAFRAKARITKRKAKRK